MLLYYKCHAIYGSVLEFVKSGKISLFVIICDHLKVKILIVKYVTHDNINLEPFPKIIAIHLTIACFKLAQTNQTANS